MTTSDTHTEERPFMPDSGPQTPAPTPPPDSAEGSFFPSAPDAKQDVAQARAVLQGTQIGPGAALKLARRLKAATKFSYARRLLLRASTHEDIFENEPLRNEILHQLALCTYKDQDVPAEERFNRALATLTQLGDPAQTTVQETLGMLGAIFKGKWTLDGQRKHLECALDYYLRGYREGPVNDQGYTSINAAFLLDQLAALEMGGSAASSDPSSAPEQRRQLARKIRESVIEQVGPLIDDPAHAWVNDKWWYYATLAEAHFGLGHYDDAVRWLNAGRHAAGSTYEWEAETCARQLAALARIQDARAAKGSETVPLAYAALERAFGSQAVPRTAFLGKLGLALSGGGFRASLYHLGVLAQLAELDVLRQVEVLSCVSGGSIVGAHYYLMVRQLLQTKPDEDITRDDYIAIVSRMIDAFVPGVQRNVRTRVAVNPLENFRMLWSSNYSRTQRAGTLYEECLYSAVKDGGENAPRWLNELTIAPVARASDGTSSPDESFSPKYQNWRRTAKVPILVLNAATLNTGHTWQFTATWMGESPAAIDSEIDGNERLRRVYYADAPEEHRQIRLGDAVGASAAVPGVFEPLTLDGLYPDRIVRLVDGGVCDNQGVVSLLEQDCKVLLVSDGSGQMDSIPAASRGALGVLLRTNSIFQARIREAEYHDLKGRRRSGLLNGLMFVHLKGDLDVNPIDWSGCQDPYDASDEARPPARRGARTRFGISKEIQRLLSGIRTDLDSFSEVEAFALMTSGYRMTEFQFKQEQCVEGFSAPPASPPWPFLQIESSMSGNGERYRYLVRLLRAGSSTTFKVWQIDPWLKYLLRGCLLLGVALFAGLSYLEWTDPGAGLLSQWWSSGATASGDALEGLARTMRGLTPAQIGFYLAWPVGGYLAIRMLGSAVGDMLATHLVWAVRWKDTLRRLALALLVSTIGFAVALLHLWVFDKRFLLLGKLQTLLEKKV
jgi:predicted acylesterase/phospholipase RssA